LAVLQNAYETYKDDGFTIIAVNNMETLNTVQRFADSANLSFPIAMDERGAVQQTFGIMGYPTSIFVGPDGKIYATHSGAIRADQLEQYIAQGLAMQ
jgi:peroxiredoxin